MKNPVGPEQRNPIFLLNSVTLYCGKSLFLTLIQSPQTRTLNTSLVLTLVALEGSPASQTSLPTQSQGQNGVRAAKSSCSDNQDSRETSPSLHKGHSCCRKNITLWGSNTHTDTYTHLDTLPSCLSALMVNFPLEGQTFSHNLSEMCQWGHICGSKYFYYMRANVAPLVLPKVQIWDVVV